MPILLSPELSHRKLFKGPSSTTLPMEAVIVSYRRGVNTQTVNQMILKVKGVESRGAAAKLVGKKVVWTSPAKKEIAGEVTAAHGNSGCVRARFESGMPGQAKATKVQIH